MDCKAETLRKRPLSDSGGLKDSELVSFFLFFHYLKLWSEMCNPNQSLFADRTGTYFKGY